jgi:hypothetical protein
MSQHIRNIFTFEFGSIPLPPHSTRANGANNSEESDKKQKRLSIPPPKMTANDHQLIGEYHSTDGNHTIKITYNHTTFNKKVYAHHLINPFVMTIGELGLFVFRDTPSKLFTITADDFVITEYTKTGPVLEAKSNFAFNSIKNAFSKLQAISDDGKTNITFLSDNAVSIAGDRHTVEMLSPLSMRAPDGSKWYYIDVRHLSLFHLSETEGCVQMTILKLDDRVSTLLQTSEYYNSVDDEDDDE